MKPLYTATLAAMEAVARRYFLTEITLRPVEGDPDTWTVWRAHGRIPSVLVTLEDGRYKLADAPEARGLDY